MKDPRRRKTRKEMAEIHGEMMDKYWSEDEDLWLSLDEKIDDDEMTAEEAAFIRGYDAERRRAQENG